MGKTIDKIVNYGRKTLISIGLAGMVGCIHHYHVQPSISRNIPSSQRQEVQSDLSERFKGHLRANCTKYNVNPAGFYCKKIIKGTRYPSGITNPGVSFTSEEEIEYSWCEIANASVIGDS